MVDTNVLISIIVFKSPVLTDMMTLVLTEHRLVLSSYVIEELKQVVARKFQGRTAALEIFLQALQYEFV
ncbi:MAG: PIN domain-containing protein [Limnochordia bacterium]|nr:PIN domain-containing protein [Limnochordia bacterium]